MYKYIIKNHNFISTGHIQRIEIIRNLLYESNHFRFYQNYSGWTQSITKIIFNITLDMSEFTIILQKQHSTTFKPLGLAGV
jgi:hypothetical protein